MKENYAFVMMIKDKWWREFCRVKSKGRDVYSYVEGGWAPPKNASLIFFYVTKPARQIAAYAEFIERKVGDARRLWKEHGPESVLSSEEKYLEFVKGKERVSFIRFKNLRTAFVQRFARLLCLQQPKGCLKVWFFHGLHGLLCSCS